MGKIIIVEDEENLRKELTIFLENHGHKVECITDFKNSLEQMKKKKSDIILLDINLPYFDGEYLCKEYRKENDTPIIMVTSKNNEIDELVSINYGADDFITKPYNPQILLARIERILYRNNNNKEDVICYNDLKLDVSKSILIYNEKKQDLSRNEMKIFYFLLKNRGKIISRDNLMDYLWDNNEFVDDNTLTVNINRLRNRLKDLEFDDIIETRRGQGYIIL